MKGKITQKGKALTTIMDGVDGKITYYTGKVDYTQTVSVSSPGRISGTHKYQVCSEKVCLPPKDKDFVFDIR